MAIKINEAGTIKEAAPTSGGASKIVDCGYRYATTAKASGTYTFSNFTPMYAIAIGYNYSFNTGGGNTFTGDLAVANVGSTATGTRSKLGISTFNTSTITFWCGKSSQQSSTYEVFCIAFGY